MNHFHLAQVRCFCRCTNDFAVYDGSGQIVFVGNQKGMSKMGIFLPTVMHGQLLRGNRARFRHPITTMTIDIIQKQKSIT